MEHLTSIAQSSKMCDWVNRNRPRHMTLMTYDDLLHWTLGCELLGTSKKTMFNAYIYAANYKHLFKNENNPVFITMSWIYQEYPSGLLCNRFDLTIESASLIHLIYERDVYIIGNAATLPETLEGHRIPEGAIVIRFNKAIIHEKKMHVCIFNDVLYAKMKCIRRSSSVNCVNASNLNTYDRFDEFGDGHHLFTTGMITLMWLSTFCSMYRSLYVLGFNMVNPGEKAHYFDTETPAEPSKNFGGHDAKNEKRLLRMMHENKALKITWVR